MESELKKLMSLFSEGGIKSLNEPLIEIINAFKSIKMESNLFNLLDVDQINSLNKSVKELITYGFQIEKLAEVYGYQKLYNKHVSIEDLVDVLYKKNKYSYGKPLNDTKRMTLKDIKGMTLKDYVKYHKLLNIYPIDINDKYPLKDLWLPTLNNEIEGFDISHLIKLNRDKLKEFLTYTTLDVLYKNGFYASDFKKAGIPIKDIKDIVGNAYYLKDGGYTIKELLESGYEAKYLYDKKLASIPELLAEGIKITQLGFYDNIEDYKIAGEDLYQILVKDGCTLDGFRDAGMRNVNYLKLIGKFTDDELLKYFDVKDWINSHGMNQTYLSGLFTYGQIKPYINDSDPSDKYVFDKYFLKHCKKNWRRQTNLLCKWDPHQHMSIDHGESYK